MDIVTDTRKITTQGFQKRTAGVKYQELAVEPVIFLLTKIKYT